MSSTPRTDSDSNGPASSDRGRLPSQDNWILWERDSQPKVMIDGYEYPLYSDARIIGQLSDGLGPYSFLNAIPLESGRWIVSAPMILRAQVYLRYDIPDMSKRNENLYHGGETIADELAALASLALGIRLLAGGASRRFAHGEDPLGLPEEGLGAQKPFLQPRRLPPMLPSVIDAKGMEALSILKSIPKVKRHRYVSLIRACRAYQQALWVAESDTNLAWVLLVSAIETAAADEISSAGTPEEILAKAKPEFAKQLKGLKDAEAFPMVAMEIAETLGSTKKFIDFALRHLPEAPKERPQGQALRIKWNRRSLREILRKVYGYRSRFLHSALPFPAPMLVPFGVPGVVPPPEVPMVGLGSYSHGGTWTREDTPINLNCFHYIVRGALLNWWNTSLNANHS